MKMLIPYVRALKTLVFTRLGKIGWVILCVGLSASLTSCMPEPTNQSKGTIRVSIVPDQEPDIIRERVKNFMAYLEKETGYKFEVIVPTEYQQTLVMFLQKNVDMAWFGGYTFVKASQMGNAVPLISRAADAEFKSVVIVRSDSPYTTLFDLKDKRFSFGSRLSTSAHLMPRAFFKRVQIEPESFFSQVEYSGAHDKTVEWVNNGKIDAGVLNPLVLQSMHLDGRIDPTKIRVIWRSPSYQDYVWAVQPTMGEDLINKIRDAFLKLSYSNEKDKQLLNDMSAHHYVPVGNADFSVLSQIIDELDM
ncbi:phosphate/phosphite/phosphonate ABC transporter substrate-binding protein [Paraneptunicella aestuarii]|uniref:phosphate/phosphite/phosphonate ABC transporter substrate-binding protein n=1 Tax=Paraneptunicella aestuarii TaxID=2831148 RepID=UPI001E5B254D|nr:phosphate/phosphite/phosphonate ABC transporter substrate-binding protein [Paraneptunicella aestuarii]UAA37124.1 phosphate/phosphite/phosphonate ABC transporter substrate-binding protein [Paraneptunicella aestuarii]